MTVTDTIETQVQDTTLTTSDLARPRGISTTAVRQAARRNPPGAPTPDEMSRGRGITWEWDSARDDVRAYLLTPEQLAVLAASIRDREGNISAGARCVGVDRQTFVRVLSGEQWSQFGTQLKVVKAAGPGWRERLTATG